MKLTRPSEVQALLATLNFHPSRKLGQNFLVDANIINFIISLVRPGKEDVVLEIGPGLGALTEPLVQNAKRVIAVEKDGRLYDYLRERFGFSSTLELIHADALDVDLNALLDQGVTKVVSNLPYSVGNRILIDLIEGERPPRYMLVTVQKEVADRLKAQPDTNDYGFISIMTQLRYDVVVNKVVSPSCFLPAPEIKSAIVELFRLTDPPIVHNLLFLKELVKFAFSHRRKQLGPLLQKNAEVLKIKKEAIQPIFAALGLKLEQRPGELSPPTWAKLANRLLGKN